MVATRICNVVLPTSPKQPMPMRGPMSSSSAAISHSSGSGCTRHNEVRMPTAGDVPRFCLSVCQLLPATRST